MNPTEAHEEPKGYQVEVLQGPKDDAEWIAFGLVHDTPQEACEFISRRINPDANVRIIETSSGLEYIDDGARMSINRALKAPDANWAFYHYLSTSDRDAFDKLLVYIDHPLAREDGTAEQRFRRLHTEGYQFALDDPDMGMKTVTVAPKPLKM